MFHNVDTLRNSAETPAPAPAPAVVVAADSDDGYDDDDRFLPVDLSDTHSTQ